MLCFLNQPERDNMVKVLRIILNGAEKIEQKRNANAPALG